jgi:flagellum-specific ATP synthase
MDGGPELIRGTIKTPIYANPIAANKRARVKERINVGIRAINTFLTMCKGQRQGIFSGSGVGKSILMSMLARNTACDVCVIGLIGERGREVNEFIEETLGPEGLAKSVIVVATSDESPLMRKRAAYTTMAAADYFRSQGLSVLCLFDSVTRFAMAQREIGLSAGEPPATKGYTPSVFAELPRILERAGPGEKDNENDSVGYTSAFFTVLVEGDDTNEPISDAVRGILDGHIILDRALAERNHFPAINIGRSISRMVPMCHREDEQQIIRKARKLLATYEDMSDMIRIGAYRPGSNQEVDEAIKFYPNLTEFLAQDWRQCSEIELDFQELKAIVSTLEDKIDN